MYDQNSNNNHFFEDGTYIKVKQLGFSYKFDNKQLNSWFGAGVSSWMKSINLQIIGENLWALTGYTGLDPEIGGGTMGFATRTEVIGGAPKTALYKLAIVLEL